MDSTFHATVMQRPREDDEESPRRDRINGGSSSNTNPRPYDTRSPPQPDFHSSPSNASHPRPYFSNPYHPPTPAPLPMPTTAHIPARPRSPMTLATPSAYQSDYQPSRDKPASNYYDPTSDSSERRPAEISGWSEGPNQTPQVRA